MYTKQQQQKNLPAILKENYLHEYNLRCERMREEKALHETIARSKFFEIAWSIRII